MRAWDAMPDRTRRLLIWSLWLVTWIGLLAGIVDRRVWVGVVAFTVAHVLLVLVLNGFRVAAFPVQARLVFLAMVSVGTFVPGMSFLLYVPMLGLVGNLFFGYCLLARLVYLLPWNRTEPFSLELVARVLTTPPVVGRFRPAPRSP
jgi:hypothetical protein